LPAALEHVMAADLRHALDPVAFAVERLAFEPDPWQARTLRSAAKRILLNCSRQSGKSTSTGVIALHTAVYVPRALILLVSPSLRQSRELMAKVETFRKRLEPGPILEEDNKLSFTLSNGSRVVCLPGSPDTIRGFSAPRLVIEDEAAYVDDNLYRAVRPMLAVSGGRIVLLSTPFGKRGFFHHEATENAAEWEVARVTAYDIPRIPRAWLEAERRRVGDWRFRQEYLCEFVDTVDQVFSHDIVMAALSADVEPLFAGAAK
jgi:hypothetical protein